MEILQEGLGLSIRRVSLEDIEDVKVIYDNNPNFFHLLTGEKDVPLEYIITDIDEAPPDVDKKNKYFIGIYLKDCHQMIGVADFLVSYPKEREGCFGFLLISEDFQDKGYGRKTVELIESWAVQHHRIRKITLGVELVNSRAYNFWKKCGYIPTGEVFINIVMDRHHDTEVFVKVKENLS